MAVCAPVVRLLSPQWAWTGIEQVQQQGQAAEALTGLDLKQQGVRRRSSVSSLTRSHSAGEVLPGRPPDTLLPSAGEEPPALPSPPLAPRPLQLFQVLAPLQAPPVTLPCPEL